MLLKLYCVDRYYFIISIAIFKYIIFIFHYYIYPICIDDGVVVVVDELVVDELVVDGVVVVVVVVGFIVVVVGDGFTVVIAVGAFIVTFGSVIGAAVDVVVVCTINVIMID